MTTFAGQFVFRLPKVPSPKWMRLSTSDGARCSRTCATTWLDSAAIRRYGGESSLLRPVMEEMASIARANSYDLAANIVDAILDTTPIESSFRPSIWSMWIRETRWR
ncbi:hypothetical protein EDB80DRAFT_60225 [Ilyonectria destructans]|nr:hypothetical protein EDB80DRAFT_60225 [Ilyonectria destructans]